MRLSGYSCDRVPVIMLLHVKGFKWEWVDIYAVWFSMSPGLQKMWHLHCLWQEEAGCACLDVVPNRSVPTFIVFTKLWFLLTWYPSNAVCVV